MFYASDDVGSETGALGHRHKYTPFFNQVCNLKHFFARRFARVLTASASP